MHSKLWTLALALPVHAQTWPVKRPSFGIRFRRAFSAIFFGSVASLFSGCVSVTAEQAVIVRYFEATSEVARARIEKVAVTRGWVAVSPIEFHQAIRKKKDPILGIVTVSEQMTVGLGFTLTIQGNAKGHALVSVAPAVMMLKPFSKNDYTRIPMKAYGSDYNQVLAVIETALNQSKFEATYP
jgi:hypothetical protein